MDGEIASIHSEVAGIRSEVSRVSSNVSRLSGEVRNLQSFQQTISKQYKHLQRSADEIKEILRLDREINGARDLRSELRRELEEEFGQHKEVRRLASNLINVVRAGFIDREIVMDVAQRRMMDLPDYWLSPATIAIAAWLADDRKRYAQAIEWALALDPSKTALLMTLLLRHHEHGDAMRKWLAAYLSGLEPTNLPADFLVVIDGVAGGVLGDRLAPNLTDRMDRWYTDATRSRDARDDAVSQWHRRLRSLGSGGGSADAFPVLAEHCPSWDALRERHEVNLALETAERHFRGRFEAGADVPLDLSDQLTALLKKLADTPGADEERLLRRIRETEAFIETGDRDAAARRVSVEEAGRSGALNILSMIAGAAFPVSRGSAFGSPSVTELLGITLSGRLIASAAESLECGTAPPSEVEIRVGTRRCVFSCADPAGPDSSAGPADPIMPEAFARQAEDLAAGLMTEIDRETFQKQGRIRTARRILVSGLTASVAGGVASYAFPGDPAWLFALPASLVGVPSLTWLSLLPLRRHTLLINANKEKEAVTRTVKDAGEELARFFGQERSGRSRGEEMRRYLRSLRLADLNRVTRRVPSPPLPTSRDDFPDWIPLPPTRYPSIPTVRADTGPVASASPSAPELLSDPE